MPANTTALYLGLPKRGDFRVEAFVTRGPKRTTCRSSLGNSELEFLRQLNLRCALRGGSELAVEFSSTERLLHTSKFRIGPHAPLPNNWLDLRASDAKAMKVRVAEPVKCQSTVGATGNTLWLKWSPEAKPWSDVALVVPVVDGEAFATQSRSLCDDHLQYLAPVGTSHLHLFATEHAMEGLGSEGAAKKRAVSVRVLIPGHPAYEVPTVAVKLPARLSGAPVRTPRNTAAESEAHTRKVAAVIDRCRGKDPGETVVKVKVAGLNGQVLSTQVRSVTTSVAACVRKRVQALRFEARGGGKDFEFTVSR